MLARTSLVLAIGTVMLAASASEAMAQRQGGRRGDNASLSSLLSMPEVLQEINVSDEQKGQVEKMIEDLRAARGGGGGNRGDFQNLSDEERRARFEEFRKQREERSKKEEDAAKLVLKPEQLDRLNELRLQRAGASALERSEVAEKVGLTQEQKDKIASISQEARRDGGGFNRDASQEERRQAAAEARERREKTNAEILALLTPEQKTKWEEMQGAKFDFPQRRGPGGN